MAKRIKILCILLCFSLLVACAPTSRKADSSAFLEASAWKQTLPLPFGGYICGFQNTTVYLQLPILFPKNTTIEIMSELRAMSLVGENVEFVCDDFLLSEGDSGSNLFSIFTLCFNVHVNKVGSFIINQYIMLLNDGSTIAAPLENIEFFITEPPLVEPILEPVSSKINQHSQTEFICSYINKGVSACNITGLTYTSSLYNGIAGIRMYKDFQLSTPIHENSISIPSHEERTLQFSLKKNEEFFKKTENIYLFLLPFLQYQCDGVDYFIPAQYQPLIIESDIDTAYFESLYTAA